MPITTKRNIYQYGHNFLVVCPQCTKRATLTNLGSAVQPDIVLACSNCSFTQQWHQPYNEIRLMGSWRWFDMEGGMRVATGASAGYGGSDVHIFVETSPDTTQKSEAVALRLWLQVICEEETLWFFNSKHLASIEDQWRKSQDVVKRESVLNYLQELRLKD